MPDAKWTWMSLVPRVLLGWPLMVVAAAGCSRSQSFYGAGQPNAADITHALESLVTNAAQPCMENRARSRGNIKARPSRGSLFGPGQLPVPI